MSAFIVSDDTINKVINFLFLKQTGSDIYWSRHSLERIGLNLNGVDSYQKLAEAMFALNVEAVEQRYGKGEAKEFRPLNFAFRLNCSPNKYQAYKSLCCWIYQCSEGDVPDQELYKQMTQVRGEIATYIVETSSEYEKASWD